MTRAAVILLSVGVALFVALLAWQGFGSVASTLMVAGWGLALVAAFHLLPLLLDACTIFILSDGKRRRHGFRVAILARWTGESVNSLLPAGQIGGPVLMVRHLSHHGMPMRDAAATITVSTTVQAVSQIGFALFGLALFALYATGGESQNVRKAALIAVVVLALCMVVFYLAQRRGLFGRLLRLVSSIFGKRDWSELTAHADAIDIAVRELYSERRRIVASFCLSFAGWLIGTGEVWLALHFLGHPVGWIDALLLESIGQAIRGAAFAIPGSLGVQEGGYLLLAPLVGLPSEAALALSLAKRARELVLGVPGILYVHLSERNWQRRQASRIPVAD